MAQLLVLVSCSPGIGGIAFSIFWAILYLALFSFHMKEIVPLSRIFPAPGFMLGTKMVFSHPGMENGVNAALYATAGRRTSSP